MTQKEKKAFKHEPNHWVAVSIDSVTDQRLDYFDRCLLMYMTFRFNGFVQQGMEYYESTQTLANVFGVHRNTVSKAIQKMKDIGYISVTSKVGGSNTYTKVTTWLNGVTPKKSGDHKQPPSQQSKPTIVVKSAVTPKPQEIVPEPDWFDDCPF